MASKVKTLWENPPPRERKTAYAKWFFRTVEKRSLELSQETKQRFYLIHAERCRRMQLCLEKHGLFCLAKGVTVDERGRATRTI